MDNINEALKGKPADSKVRQKLNYARKHWPAALDKYEQQEKVLGANRNSYSKTDPDATFMRMKEDHMKNGQLKPAYNVQICTNNQFIASYSIHQATTDSRTLIPHIEQHIKHYKTQPANITADAGYGSEQNYEWLEQKRITAYVKHGQFDRQQNEKIRNQTPYAPDKLQYNAEKDLYYCPAGKPMNNIGHSTRRNRSGFPQTLTFYRDKMFGLPITGAMSPGTWQPCHRDQS